MSTDTQSEEADVNSTCNTGSPETYLREGDFLTAKKTLPYYGRRPPVGFLSVLIILLLSYVKATIVLHLGRVRGQFPTNRKNSGPSNAQTQSYRCPGITGRLTLGNLVTE